MEIFSYYEPQGSKPQRLQLRPTVKSSLQPQTEPFFTPTFSPTPVRTGILDNQQFSRPRRKASVDIYQIISAAEENARAFLLKITVAALCCLALAGVLRLTMSFSRYIEDTVFDPLLLEPSVGVDTNLVNTAMKNFILVRAAGETVDSGGNILSDTLKEAVSFSEPVTFTTYTVKKNDNITSIAKSFGLTNVSTLIAVNNIDNVRRIQAGKRLTVPSIDGMFYESVKGDTLESVSEKYDVSIEKLVDVNDLSSSVLTVGQKLFIPGAKMSADNLKRALGELFVSPISIAWRLSSNYGYRPDPFTGVRSFHTGIDMVAPIKTPIRAASDGKVSVVSYSSVYGNYVVITHDGGYQTLYAHLFSSCVQVGQRITQGTKLGLLGNTGYSTGAHLHFTVYKNGKTINPYEVLN